MTTWPIYKLGEIAHITTGFPFKGDLYSSVGTRVLRGENIGDKVLRWDSHRDKRWNQPFERADDYALRADDIVLAMDGNVGKNKARIKTDDLPLFLAQRVACVRNNQLSDQVFLYYVLNSREFADYLNSVKTGTTIQHISMKQIADFKFALPPLAEQGRIAAILGALDDKIELNRRINANLEEQAQGLFIELLNALDNKRQYLLGDIIDIGSGKAIKSEKEGLYPVLGANGEIGRTNNYLFNDRLLFTGRVGTLGRVYRIEEKKVWLSDNTLIIKPKIGYNFIYFTLKNTDLCSYNVGSTQPLIRQSDIKNIKIALPADKKLDHFENLCDSLFAEINKNNDQNAILSSLRDALLPKLMRGEINV